MRSPPYRLMAFCSALAAAVAVAWAAPAEAGGCTTAARSDVVAVQTAWVKVMADRDPEAATALYSRQAILTGLGTGSVRIGQREIAQHFTAFFGLEPRIETAAGPPLVAMLSCAVAEVRGVVLLTYDAGASRERRVPIRYMLKLRRTDARWFIVHQHAAMPTRDDEETAASAGRAASAIETSGVARRSGELMLPPPMYLVSTTPPIILAPVHLGLRAAARKGQGNKSATVELPPRRVAAPDVASDTAVAAARPVIAQVSTPVVVPIVAMEPVLPAAPFAIGAGPPVIDVVAGPREALPPIAALSVLVMPSAAPDGAASPSVPVPAPVLPPLELAVPSATLAEVSRRFADISRFLGAMFDPPLKAVAGFEQRTLAAPGRRIVPAAPPPTAPVVKRAAPAAAKKSPATASPPPAATSPGASPMMNWQGNGPG